MKIPSGDGVRLLRHDLTAVGGRYTGSEPGRALSFAGILNDMERTGRQENEATLAKDVLEAMVRMIEEQVRDHRIHSLRGRSGGWPGAGLWGAALRHVCDVSPSINRRTEDEAGHGTAYADRFNRLIDYSSQKHGVDAGLIRAVIRAESGFDPRATSSKGAMGLMQLMPETARDLGVDDPYDPVQNVMAGTEYLKTLLHRYNGDTNTALAAYNWGMGNVERNPGRLPEETKTYITRITRYRDEAAV